MTMLSDGMLLGAGGNDFAITGIRLRGLSTGGDTSWCAREIEFRNTAGYGGSKISGTPFATSTASGYPASQAFDSNTTTFWSSDFGNPWLCSIGITCTAMRSDLKSVRWLSFNVGRAPGSIAVEYQKVDTTWVQIGTLPAPVADMTWYGIPDTSI